MLFQIYVCGGKIASSIAPLAATMAAKFTTAANNYNGLADKLSYIAAKFGDKVANFSST